MEQENATKKQSVSEIITSQIITALERGVVPWAVSAKKTYNAKSLREYSGLNKFLLADAITKYNDLRFLTFNEVKAEGGSILEGESGTIVYFSNNGVMPSEHKTLLQQCLNCEYCSNKQCKLSEEKLEWQTAQALLKDEAKLCDDFKSKTIYASRYYRVFNIQQTTLKDSEKFNLDKKTTLQSAVTVDEVLTSIEQTGLRINLASQNSGYDAELDSMNVLSKGSFDNESNFYQHLFTLMSAACGHESRLKLSYLYEIEDIYSYGAIVNQMAAAMICGEIGIEISQHDEVYTADYIAGLIRVLREDSRFVLMAANSAKRVVNYLLQLNQSLSKAA